MSKISDAFQSQHTFYQNAVRLVANEGNNQSLSTSNPAINQTQHYGSDAAERLKYQALQNGADSYFIGIAPPPQPLKAPDSSVYLPSFESSSVSTAPAKKKKRGFFGRIGHALKKFASSKFGKLMLIGGAIAGSFLIPGLGAGLTNLLSSAGRTLMGSAGKMFAQTGLKSLFQGGLKAFVKTQVLPRFGLNNGLKAGIKTFLKEQFLSPSALKSGAKDLVKSTGLGNLFSAQGLKGAVSKLASHFGFNRAWLQDLISSDPAPPKNKIETWL